MRSTARWVGMLALLLPASATGLTIDAFSDGDFSATDLGGGGFVLSTQTGVSALGGVRESVVTAQSTASESGTLSVGSGVSTVSSAASTTEARWIYDGIDNVGNSGTLGALAVDLTAGGGDRFQIDVTSIVGSVFFRVLVFDSSGSSTSTFHAVSATGVEEIPFSEISTDLTDVRALELAVFAVGNGESVTLDSFTTNSVIPEPATALLLASALTALAASRRGPTRQWRRE